MSAVKFFGRRLKWVGLAAAALIACAAPPGDDTEDSEGAASSGACESSQAAYISGNGDFSAVQSACSKQVADYTASSPQDFDWFKNSPLGLAGPPLGILLAMMDDHDIWPPNTLGLGTDPQPANSSHPNMGLPYGLVYAGNPETHLRHVFFSCGGCHTGRVIGPEGKIEHVYGAPNTEVDAQMFGWRMRDSMLGKPGGKEGYVVAEKDANGNFVFDEEGYPKFQITASGNALKGKAIAKAGRLPGVFQGDTSEELIYIAAWGKIMKKLVAGAVRTDTLYSKLTSATGSYPEDARSPKRVGPRPGMMDAYGFASGLVYTHAMRDDYFAKIKARYGADYANHAFFKGLVTAGQTDADLFAKARARIQNDPGQWLSHEPAPVDVKSLFNVGDRPNVGWDGNQASSARVIASGTSSVGDPWNVNLPIHEGMNDFVNRLPAAPYPFKVDDTAARAGAAIFKNECASCHKKGNDAVYKLAEIKTDPNRANVASPLARAGLIELMRQACDGTGNGTSEIKDNTSIGTYKSYSNKNYSNAWCTPKGPKGETLTLRQQDNDLWRESAVRGSATVGYKADDLRGIWIQAPYLHNGSVPTLWHLLTPEDRPATFARGNIAYDQKKGGFAWDVSDPKVMNPSYPAYAAGGTPEAAHVVPFNTALRGQTNVGHDYGSELSDEQKLQLIEYMKTL